MVACFGRSIRAQHIEHAGRIEGGETVGWMTRCREPEDPLRVRLPPIQALRDGSRLSACAVRGLVGPPAGLDLGAVGGGCRGRGSCGNPVVQLGCHVDLESGEGVVELVEVAGADDGCGDSRCAIAHATARLAGWWLVSRAMVVNFSAVT